MVYLLNAKLKRALNGEKIDDDKENEENGDNDYCSNCNLLRKEKKLLEDKIQNLLDTIHEKDLELAKLKEMLGMPDNYQVLVKDKGKKGKKNKKKGKKGEKGEKGEKAKDKDEKKRVKKTEKIKQKTEKKEKTEKIKIIKKVGKMIQILLLQIIQMKKLLN